VYPPIGSGRRGLREPSGPGGSTTATVTDVASPAPRPSPGRRDGRRGHRPRGIGWLLALLAFLPVAVLRAGDLAESDTFWQVRTGQYILGHASIPMTDPFSWTARGAPWQMNSWGFDVLLALADRIGGLPGVAVLCAVLVLGIAGLTLLLARRLGATPFGAGVLLVAASPLLIEWLSARPQLVDYAAVLVLCLVLRRAAAGPLRARDLLGLAVLAVAWVNLHAGVLLGAGLAAASALAVAVPRATRARAPWFVAAAAVMAGGSLINPYGVGVLTQTWSVRAAAVDLAEWQPLNPLDLVHALPVIAGLAAIALLLRRRELVLATCLALLVAGSFVAIRFVPMVLLLAVAAIAPVAARGAVARYVTSRAVMLRRTALIGVAAFAVVAAPNLLHLGRPDPSKYSMTVVSAIPSGCRLFNSYDLGGFVLLERPDLAVSIDSRAELYGAATIRHYTALVDGRADPAAALAPVRCVLLPPGAPLVARLSADGAWRTLRADRAAVLLVRA
jgi:hypothetical protein